MDYELLRVEVGTPPKNRQYEKIYVCSPLSAPTWLEITENMENARYYAGKVARRFGCRAIATHAYLPLILDDKIPEEREIALDLGIKVLATCDALIVCGRRITSGMAGEIRKALELGIPILFLEDFA